MSLGAVSLILGIVGSVVAVSNQVQRFIEKRRLGTVDERRLDIEGLQTLVTQQREEMDDMRVQRREDRAQIDQLRHQVDELDRDLRRATSDLRTAHTTIDRLQLALEVKK